MNGSDTFIALKDHQDRIIKDIPIGHIVKGVQVLNRALYVRYFKGYRIQVVGKKRVKQMVAAEIHTKKNDELAQMLATLWNRANGKLYHSMYNLVRTVNEEVDLIEKIEDEDAGRFIDELMEEFDAESVYLCVLLNEVKFSREVVKEKLGFDILLEEWPPPPDPEEEEEAEAEAEAAPEAE